MIRTLVHLLLVLTTLMLQTLAGSCQSKIPDACIHRPLPGQRWACGDPKLQFPTVTCLTKDVLTCGKVKKNWCVFYSMGAVGTDALDYANDDMAGLNGVGVTFHMALDDKYIKQVIGQERFRITDTTSKNAAHLNRQNIYVRKLSQVFASVCTENAFVMVLKRNGKSGGVGAYQTPWVNLAKPVGDRHDNVWENDEFPPLQLNDKIKRVYSVDVSNNNRRTIDWTQGQPKKPLRNVEAIPLPP